MTDYRDIHTPRLLLRPVGWPDLPELTALKGDPGVFAIMLGGVRTPAQTALELAEEVRLWGEAGVGIWTIRGRDDDVFHGITGMMRRADGLGMSLRFALWPRSQGRGLAREAAGAALRFAHDWAGLARIVAVAREDNFASRTVLGGIGMRLCDGFLRDGRRMVVFESVRALPSDR